MATSIQPLQPSQAPTNYPVGQLPQAGTPQNNEFGFETFTQPFAGADNTVPATQLEDVEITANKPTETSFNLSPERLAQINAAYGGDEKELNKGRNSASSDSGEIKFTPESERRGNRAAYLYNKVLEGVGSVASGLGDIATMAGASMGTGGNPTVISTAVKSYRQQIAPDVRKYLKETVGANVDKGREAKYNSETITSALGGVFNSAPAMALTAASGGLGTGAMFLQSYDNTLESIDQTEEGRNLDPATKTLFAGTVGIATALLEKYSFDKIFKGETGIIGNAIAKRALKNANRETSGKVTGDILTRFLDKEIVNLSNKFVKRGAKLADASIVEYVTEAAQEATQAGGELLLNKATGKPVFDTSETSKWDGFLSRVNKAGVAGAIGGAFMGGLSMGISNLAGVKKYDIDESQVRLNDINTALNNEALSDEAKEVLVQEKIKIQNEAQKIADKVDSTYEKLDDKQKNRVNDIVAEQVRIEEAISDENIPESVKENLTKQSEDLNTELSEIKPTNETLSSIQEMIYTQEDNIRHWDERIAEAKSPSEKAEYENDKIASQELLDLYKEKLKNVKPDNKVNEKQKPTSEVTNNQETATPTSEETVAKAGEESIELPDDKFVNQEFKKVGVNNDGDNIYESSTGERVRQVAPEADAFDREKYSNTKERKDQYKTKEEYDSSERKKSTPIPDVVDFKKENGDVVQVNTKKLVVKPEGEINFDDPEYNNRINIEFDGNIISNIELSVMGDEVRVLSSDIPGENRNKLLGKASYIKLGEFITSQGKTLRSSDAEGRNEMSDGLWRSLERDGLAEKITTGKGSYYIFKSKQEVSKPRFTIKGETVIPKEDVITSNETKAIAETKTDAGSVQPTANDEGGNGTENKVPTEERKKVSEDFEKLANRSLETEEIRETGSNVEEVTGDTLDFGDKTYKASTFEKAIPMGIEVVESAKNEFGKSYVTDLLGYLNDNKNIMSMDKRALITLSLENDLRKQLLAEPDNITLKKQVQLVTKAGIELLREGAKSVSLGRIRRMVDLGYDAEKLTDTFFSAKQKESKSKLVNAIESTSDDINKEAVVQEESKAQNDQVQSDLIEEAVNKGVEAQINEIYRKLPSERRKRADKAINAIEKFQKSLRSKTYDASIGVPVAILDAGLTTIKQAIKAGVRVADAIELGIAKIKEKHGKWTKEDEFRKDMLDSLKKDAIDTESGTSLTSAETQRKAYIARLEKDIRDLEEQISKGEKKVVTKEDKYANDAEIKKLRDTRDAKKEQLDVADPSYKENQEVERAIKQTTKSITDLENKLANNDLSSDTKNTAVWTKEIGELKLKQQALQEELNEKIKANRPPKPQPTDTEIAEAKLETAKKNVQKRIDDLNTEIANKQRNTKKGVDVVADKELANLKMQRDVLTKIRDKELPVSRTPITDEAKAKAQVTRLEKEIADLDEQIANGQKTPKNQSRPALTTPQIDKLKAEKQSRLDVLNEIDPDKRDLVNRALIDAGFGREISVKTKDGKEKRTVLDWKKLAGEESSVDNIRERVEEFLKKKGYSENEILRMQDDLVGQYNDLHASIIEKSLNELENRNKESKPVEAKSEARRLAELYNFGLFERESDTYDNIINRAVGLSQIGQEAFNEAKVLARAMATILNTKGADGKPLPEISVKKALNDVQDAQEKLLTKVANSEADWRYKTANVIGEYASIGQRALLMSLNQVIENPLSGFVERGIQFLGDKATGTMDTPAMRKQRQELAGVQLRDILMNAGDDFGHKKSIFISKSDAMDFINGYKDTKAWHSFTSVFLGRAYLEGADSMHKIALTQRMFSRNAIKILIGKGMSKEQATTFVSEKLTGQSFIDAKVEAKNLIKTVNEQAGKDLLPSNDQSVTLLANDLIKANLIDYAGLTERELNIAFKAGYTVAGYGMGHESNNLLSEGIKLVNQKIQGKLKESIKNKDWGAAAGYRLQNALFNSVLNPFVGGGTNWTVLTLTKMGINPLAYVNALKRTKIDVMTEAGQKTLREDLVKQGRNRGDALRVVTGAAISLALLASTRLTDEDDDFAKWKKRNKVLAKFVDKASPAALIFINAYDQNQAGDEKAMDKAWDKVFGVKAVNYFDDSKKVAKATHIFTPKNETDWQEAWGAIGQLTLGKVNAPVPSWKVVKDFMDISKALSGEAPNPVDYKVGGFFNGAYQGGFVENNGFVNMRPDRIIATYDPKSGKEEVLRGKEKRRYDSLLQLVTAEHVEAKKEDLNKLSPSERQEQVKAIATRASKEVLELMSGYSDKTKKIEDGGKNYELDAKQIRQRIEFAKEYNERYGEKLEKMTNALVRKGMSESEAAIEARKEYKSDVNSYTREQMLKLNKRGEITLKEKE